MGTLKIRMSNWSIIGIGLIILLIFIAYVYPEFLKSHKNVIDAITTLVVFFYFIFLLHKRAKNNLGYALPVQELPNGEYFIIDLVADVSDDKFNVVIIQDNGARLVSIRNRSFESNPDNLTIETIPLNQHKRLIVQKDQIIVRWQCPCIAA